MTTIRDPGGIHRIQRLTREVIDAGKRVGPRMFIAGAILDGNPPVFPTNWIVDTPRRAVSAVTFLIDEGVNCIKVYNNLTEAVFEAVLKTAKARNVIVLGHVPHVMTVTHAVEMGLVTDQYEPAIALARATSRPLNPRPTRSCFGCAAAGAC